MQAGPGLRLGLAFRLFLVDEHEGVAAPVAVVDGERVAAEHALQPRVALDFLLRQRLAAAMAAETRARRLGRAQIRVVLPGEVDAPFGRIRGVFGDFDQPNVGLGRLGLSLENVDEKRRNGCCRNRHDDDESQYAGRTPSA